jgi:hypothetical protein
LEPREEETLLAGASFDFTTEATSWKEGSSAAVASTEGAVAASFFGFHCYCKGNKKHTLCISRKKGSK